MILAIANTMLVSCTTAIKKHYTASQQEMQRDWRFTDFNKRNVNLQEIVYQAIPKDAIPAIDAPTFVHPSDVNWIKPKEPVILVNRGQEVKAYPIQIMLHHEIVNDFINGEPIAVTYCPLCNTSLVYSRELEGKTLRFSATGSLRNSNLIMFDRDTESWWQQFTGEAVVGIYLGKKLRELPSKLVAYQDFKSTYPNGKVLSRNTGYQKQYGENPYNGYDNIDSSPSLYFKKIDKRLKPKERVLAVSIANQFRIYPFQELEFYPVINDRIANEPIVVFSQKGMLSPVDQQWIDDSKIIPSAVAYSRRVAGQTLNFQVVYGKIMDQETGSTWNILGQAIKGGLKGRTLTQVDRGVHFAFSWLAFQPESEIYKWGFSQPR